MEGVAKFYPFRTGIFSRVSVIADGKCNEENEKELTSTT